MRKFLQFGFLALLVAPQLHAGEIANLRNGFSIRHEHHEVVGDTTRLYMSADPSSGYVDVLTAQIESFEPAPPEPQAAKARLAEGSWNSTCSKCYSVTRRNRFLPFQACRKV